MIIVRLRAKYILVLIRAPVARGALERIVALLRVVENPLVTSNWRVFLASVRKWRVFGNLIVMILPRGAFTMSA